MVRVRESKRPRLRKRKHESVRVWNEAGKLTTDEYSIGEDRRLHNYCGDLFIESNTRRISRSPSQIRRCSVTFCQHYKRTVPHRVSDCLGFSYCTYPYYNIQYRYLFLLGSCFFDSRVQYWSNTDPSLPVISERMTNL